MHLELQARGQGLEVSKAETRRWEQRCSQYRCWKSTRCFYLAKVRSPSAVQIPATSAVNAEASVKTFSATVEQLCDLAADIRSTQLRRSKAAATPVPVPTLRPPSVPFIRNVNRMPPPPPAAALLIRRRSENCKSRRSGRCKNFAQTFARERNTKLVDPGDGSSGRGSNLRDRINRIGIGVGCCRRWSCGIRDRERHSSPTSRLKRYRLRHLWNLLRYLLRHKRSSSESLDAEGTTAPPQPESIPPPSKRARNEILSTEATMEPNVEPVTMTIQQEEQPKLKADEDDVGQQEVPVEHAVESADVASDAAAPQRRVRFTRPDLVLDEPEIGIGAGKMKEKSPEPLGARPGLQQTSR